MAGADAQPDQTLVRIADNGDYLVPRKLGEHVRRRVSKVKRASWEVRRETLRELVEVVTREGVRVTRRGRAPDVVIPDPERQQPTESADTGTDVTVGHGPVDGGWDDGYQYDIDPTDPPRG
jgi:hypothetical protein